MLHDSFKERWSIASATLSRTDQWASRSAKPQPPPRRIARARLARTSLAAFIAVNAVLTVKTYNCEKMDDSSDDGAAVLAHATPGRRHSWASVHTPIDWSSAASLRAELARVDARRATLLNALAALEDGVEALHNSSSDEESCCDLTQATARAAIARRRLHPSRPTRIWWI